jgi:hypothetical protein
VCQNHILIGQSDYICHKPGDLISVVCFARHRAAEFDVRVDTKLCDSSLKSVIITRGGTLYLKTHDDCLNRLPYLDSVLWTKAETELSTVVF